MKKLLIVMSIIVILVCQAAAEGLSVADVWLNNEAAALIPAGVEAQCTRTEFPFSLPNERQAVSVSLTAEGNLKFGRYDQVTHTALLDAITGEKIELEEVFSDLEVLQDYLNTYVEQNVMDLLNTYLDAADILPVPTDCVSFDEYGITFHYPSERFRYFSGHAGAIQLQWYELADYLIIDPPAVDQLTEARQGKLFGISMYELLDNVLNQYGSLSDPDIIYSDQLIYDFENPALRGVQVIGNPQKIEGELMLRTTRFDFGGVYPGMTREETEGILGMPTVAGLLDMQTVTLSRLRPGYYMEYSFSLSDGISPNNSEICAMLYFDETDSLYQMELRGRH